MYKIACNLNDVTLNQCKMKYLGYILVACAFVMCISVAQSENCPARKKVVCYYASWAIYRVGAASMNTTHIDETLCTHIVYTFAGLNILENKIYPLDPWNDLEDNGGKNSYKKFIQLKEKNPCLKTLLAIGGWNEDSKKYSVMAYTAESRKEFSKSVLRYLVHYGFDGIDMDWEYPAHRGGIQEDKKNFVELLKELKTQLSPWNLLVTVAVAVTEDIVEQAYDIAEMAKYVDYISIMAYDFTSGDSETTGLLAPLKPDKAGEKTISTSIEYWLKYCSAEKLILGIPMYARPFKLESPKNTGIGAPTVKNDMKGKFTGEIGFLSQFELEETLLRHKYEEKANDVYQNCYATNGTYWITYDTEETIKAKVKYALDKGLGGMMAWSIDTDDFQGLFSQNKYPLLQAINDGLYNKNN